MKMNTQARVKSSSQVYYWESYGDVTHQAAAEKHATRHPFSYLIVETRWEGKDTVFPHEVVRRTGFHAKQLRRDNDDNVPKAREELEASVNSYRPCENCGKPVPSVWDYAWCEECGKTESCPHGNEPHDCNECMSESDIAYDEFREKLK